MSKINSAPYKRLPEGSEGSRIHLVVPSDTTSEADATRVLYSDVYVTLTSTTLLLKGSFVWPKEIALTSMASIRRGNELGWYEIKQWGIGATGIVWAADFKRFQWYLFPTPESMSRSFVVKVDGGSMFRSCFGFSVEDPVKFKRLLDEARMELRLERLN